MKTSKIIGVAGSFAICLGATGFLSAASDPTNPGQPSRTGAPPTIQPAAGIAVSSVSTNTAPAIAATAQLPLPLPQLPSAGTPPPVPGAPAAAAPAAAGAAPAAAPAAPRTLWTFLGFPSCDKIHEACAKLKLLLGVPPAPAALGSQEAMNSPNAAVSAAAKAKAEKDAKPAKIKAIRYLASLENACCYPDVKEALLKVLEPPPNGDCDWEVRREAAAAFGKACCCDEKVLKRLKEIITPDANGKYKEPVADVRCAAEKSLNSCLCKCGAIPEPESEGPKGTPEGTPQGEKPAGVTRRAIVADPLTALLVVAPDMEDDVLTLVATEEDAARASLEIRSTLEADEASIPITVPLKPIVYVPPFKGSIVSVDRSAGVAQLEVLEGDEPPVGARAQLYHRYPIRTVHVGEVEVIGTFEGKLLVRPSHAMSLQQIKKGDRVAGGQSH